jgi:carbonic anhydrase
MDKIKKMFDDNKVWAKGMLDADPEYFKSMAKGQTPSFLWIGCADSRVPPTTITNTNPGEMFVHRNIANLVIHTDTNLQSVLQYAVEVLKVPHIIVCGHYNCGGVKAALQGQSLGLIDNWLRNIKDVFFTHKEEIDAVAGDSAKVNRLVELSVIQQVQNLANTAVVQKAWLDHNAPFIHGMVHDLNTGLLKELITLSPASELDSVYKYTF